MKNHSSLDEVTSSPQRAKYQFPLSVARAEFADGKRRVSASSVGESCQL